MLHSARTLRRAAATASLTAGVLNLVLALVEDPPIVLDPVAFDAPWGVREGSRFLLAWVGLAGILVVRGLLRGRRNAWWIATIGAGISLSAHEVQRANLVGLLVSVTLLALLLAARPVCAAPADRADARRGWLVLIAGQVVVVTYGVGGAFLLDTSFTESPTRSTALFGALRLVVLEPTSSLHPATSHGAWFLDSVRSLSLIVLATGTWLVIRGVRARPRDGTDRERVRAILHQHATTTLAHFHLLDDKHYVFSRDGQAFVGYATANGCAIALGEPIGPEASAADAAQQFIDLAHRQGWLWAFHQVTPAGLETLAPLHAKALKIGEEAVIETAAFSLAGSHFKDLRRLLRRLDEAGVVVRELEPPIDRETLAQMRTVSDAWLAQGGHRERTFTLGAFDELTLRETPVIAAFDAAGRMVAFVNLLPPYRSRVGTFDLMRRLPDAPTGAMDLLMVRQVARAGSDGLDGLSLGLAPLTAPTASGVLGTALRQMYAHGDRAFRFRGLHAYKAKWQPTWEPRHLVYRADLELPTIALALARVGEARERSSPARDANVGRPRVGRCRA